MPDEVGREVPDGGGMTDVGGMAIVIPAAGDLGIAARSAIVAVAEGAWLRLDYEGAVHGQSNLGAFAERLVVAAGRSVVDYPTVARRLARPDEVRAVGTYDPWRHVVVAVTDAAALEAWAGEGVDAIRGLRVPTGPLVGVDPRDLQLRAWGQRGGAHWFRTRAGQVLSHGIGGSVIMEVDDPRVPAEARERWAPARREWGPPAAARRGRA